MTSRLFLRAAMAAAIVAATSIVQPGLEGAAGPQAPAAQAAARAERTAWYFYRVKWGFQDEFVDLFQKNHYPVLRAQMKTGRIVARQAGSTLAFRLESRSSRRQLPWPVRRWTSRAVWH